MFLSKIGAGVAVSAALALGASPALAASGWTIVPAPPARAERQPSWRQLYARF
jgi:hypothetical protein